MKIFLEDLDEFESAQSAADYYRQEMERLSEEGSEEEFSNLQFLKIFEQTISEFVSSTQLSHHTIPIHPDFQPEIYLVYGEMDGSFCVREKFGAYLILIDSTTFLSILMMIFYMDSEKTYTGLLLSWFYLQFTTSKTPIPHLYFFFFQEVTGNEKKIDRLSRGIGQYILFHEIGHIHQNQYPGVELLNIKIAQGSEAADPPIEAQRIYSLGPKSNLYTYFEDPWSKEPFLLFPLVYQKWLVELRADIFTCYVKLNISLNQYNNQYAHLDRLTDFLSLWQITAFFLYHKEKTQAPSQTHPNFHIRMDSLIFHLEVFARKLQPDWTSSKLSNLQRQYLYLWSEGVKQVLGDAFTFTYYTIDGSGPEIDPGAVQSFAKDHPILFSYPLFEHLDLEVYQQLIGFKDLDPGAKELEWTNLLDKFSTQRLNDELIIQKLAISLKKTNLKFQIE